MLSYFLVLIAVVSLYLLLRRSLPRKNVRLLPPIEDILLHPDEIRLSLYTYKTPPLSGYPLKIMTDFYYTVLGRAFISRFVIPSSNLNLFANCVLPESPTSTHTVPHPCYPTEKAKDVLNSLMIARSSDSKCKSVRDFYAAYKSGQATPLDVANAVLTAIEESNRGEKALRAIVSSNRKQVLSMAKASMERWKNDSQLSFLDGVPISIKEDFLSDVYPSHCGTTFIPHITKHGKKSRIVEKLIKAGAVIIGMTNMPEFGCNNIGNSENRVHKQPRNPHNIDYFSGGSSSGCGVSVAAGLCPISVGGDGGGSTRVPAAVCGVYTLKPTQGLVSDGGTYGSTFSFSTVSPLTSSPLDMAVFMEAVCEKKSAMNFEALDNIKTTLDDLKIGVYFDWLQFADKDTVTAFNDAVEKLKMLGAVVKEIKIPELEEVRVAHTITSVTELSALLSKDVEKHFSDLGPEALLVAAMGNCFSAIESTNVMKQRTRSIKALEHIFNEIDVIATPTTACQIVPIIPEYLTAYGVVDAESVGKLAVFVFLAAFTGLPAISIPIGTLNEDLKLPAGLQLMAPWYHDIELIKYAMIIEASSYFTKPTPSVMYNILDGSN